MSDLLPRVKPHPTDPSQGDVMNASAIIEVARRTRTPQSEAFLKAFHAAEADVAREQPFLSEGKIRSEAVIRAMKALGARVTVDGKPA